LAPLKRNTFGGTKGVEQVSVRTAAAAVLIAAAIASAGCTRPSAVPVASQPPGSATAVAATVTGGPQAPTTAADLDAAKRLILAHDPDGGWTYTSIQGDLRSQADLDASRWWDTHASPPYKSLRLWAPVAPSPTATATPATSHVWDLIQASADSSWTIANESSSSE
jgi:hypothetical protein